MATKQNSKLNKISTGNGNDLNFFLKCSVRKNAAK